MFLKKSRLTKNIRGFNENGGSIQACPIYELVLLYVFIIFGFDRFSFIFICWFKTNYKLSIFSYENRRLIPRACLIYKFVLFNNFLIFDLNRFLFINIWWFKTKNKTSIFSYYTSIICRQALIKLVFLKL